MKSNKVPVEVHTCYTHRTPGAVGNSTPRWMDVGMTRLLEHGSGNDNCGSQERTPPPFLAPSHLYLVTPLRPNH